MLGRFVVAPAIQAGSTTGLPLKIRGKLVGLRLHLGAWKDLPR
jgi:hypothetical protein